MEAGVGQSEGRRDGDHKPWTFITNHTRVLIVIAEDPDARIRDISETIGITERATQRIVAELEEAGYLSHDKVGRRNRYQIQPEMPLRHELNRTYPMESLLDIFVAPDPGSKKINSRRRRL